MKIDIKTDSAKQRQSDPLIETLLVFAILAVVLALIMIPAIHFFEPDELCYYFSSQAIRSGKLWLSPEELESYRNEATTVSQLWPHDLGYVRIEGRYVLVKAPGFPMYLAVLRLLSMERLGNIILLVAATLLMLFLGQRTGKPGTALLGVVLMTLSPICLVMQYRAFMSDYAAAAFLWIAGGGLIILGQPQEKDKGLRRSVHSLLIGFLFGYSVVLRLTNVGAVFLMVCIHLCFLFSCDTGKRANRFIEMVALISGGCLALCILFAYNHAVFGRFMATGYQLQDIRPQDTTFIAQQFARGYWYAGYETVLRNLVVLPEILLRGLPWWPAIPAAMLWCHGKMERRTWWLLSGWIFGICLVFFQYRMLMPHNFVIISRMYLPLAGPAALMVALCTTDISRRAALLLGFFTLIAGLLFYLFFLGTFDATGDNQVLNTVFGGIRDVIGVFEPLRCD